MNSEVTKRFLAYTAFPTQSDNRSSRIPSTKGQLELAEKLTEELKEIGVCDAHTDEYGRVYGHIPASPGCTRPCLALIAHMDTAMDIAGAPVHARILKNYNGEDILLNEEKDIWTRVSDFPGLREYKGQDLIVTDGTTLLGADDKAGIAEIMTLLHFLKENPEFPHPAVAVHFTPDEEIGRGADHTDLEKLGAAYGYTVDGGAVGELSFETFNASSAIVTVHGVTAHTGYARGILKNAIQIAIEYQSLLPPYEIPACTQGREGFYHLDRFEGTVGKAVLTYLIRDHSYERYLERRELMKEAASFLNRRYGSSTVELELKESYLNMYEKIKDHPELIDYAATAMKQAGVTPGISPVRGGTDGSRLSYMGLPCPNLCTGGQNGHGRHEFISCQAMEQTVEILKNLVRLFA